MMPTPKARIFVDDILTVGFVEKGDDPDALVAFFKRAEPKEEPMTPLQKLMKAIGQKLGMKDDEMEKLLADDGVADGGSNNDGDANTGGDMPFDVSKLDASAQEAFEKLQTQLATVAGERDELQKSVDADGGGSDEDVLKGASPEVQALVKAAQDEAAAAKAESAAAVEKVNDLVEKRENERFIKIVTGEMASLPQAPADDFAPILRKCHAALDDEEYVKLVTVLKAASAQIKEGLLLKRIGSPVVGATSVDAEIVAKTEELRKAHPQMTEQQARGQVFIDNPQLRQQRDAELRALNGED